MWWDVSPCCRFQVSGKCLLLTCQLCFLGVKSECYMSILTNSVYNLWSIKSLENTVNVPKFVLKNPVNLLISLQGKKCRWWDSNTTLIAQSASNYGAFRFAGVREVSTFRYCCIFLTSSFMALSETLI